MHDRRATTPTELTLEQVIIFWQTSILGPRLTQFQIRARKPVVVAGNCRPGVRTCDNEDGLHPDE